MRAAIALAGALACSACTAASLPVIMVTATAETVPVGTADADAADDPAIWRNPAAPEASLIVATDKKAGLYVYGLDGEIRHFVAAGRLNNVDLADLGADRGIIVVASDRNDPANAQLQVYQLDPVSARLLPVGKVDGGRGEGYGLCLLRTGEGLHAFSVLKDGRVVEVALDIGAAPEASSADANVSGRVVREFALPSQAEGCVADDRNGTLYVAEEAAGIWRFLPGETRGTLVAPVDGRQLVADAEGLALIAQGADCGMLVASSQGDNAFAVYRLPDFVPLGRFRIGAGKFGATEETDGIALVAGDFGAAYPDGLFVAQDGNNEPAAQNFKLVSWASVTERFAPAAGGQEDCPAR